MTKEVLAGTQDHITATAAAQSSTKLLPAGSVAIVVRSGILERRIPVAIVPFQTTLNQDIKSVIPRAGVDARWIAWGLRSAERQILSSCRKAGTTVASLNVPALYDFRLPVPPLDQQCRIVEILEEHLSHLGAAEASLTATRRRGDQLLAKDLTARAAGVGLPLGEDCVQFGSTAVRIPTGWRASTIGAEAHVVQYGTSTRAHSERVDGDLPMLRMGNIRSGRVDLGKLKFVSRDAIDTASLTLTAGDLLFNRTNSAELVGKCAVFAEHNLECTFASYLIRVRLGGGVVPEWAAMLINSSLGRAYIARVASQQVGQANVNGTKLKAFPILVPPIDVQNRLIDAHRGLAESLSRTDGAIAQVLARAASLRHSLLAAAFSGRLTGRPSDLERAEEAIA